MINKNILIVEDEKDLRSVVRNSFDLAFIKCFEAGDCNEAMQIITSVRPEVVVMDYALRDDNGIKLISKITTEVDYEPLIVVYSGAAKPIPTKEFPMEKAIYIYEKPCDASELLAYIKKLLGEK